MIDLREITDAFKPISFVGKRVITGKTSHLVAGNVDGEMVTHIFTEKDVEYSIDHHRNRVPSSFQPNGGNGGTIYSGATAWNKKKIYLKSTTANNTVKLLIL